MYTVELYVKIRRAVMVEGRSEREVAQYFGVHRKTVKKMCQYAVPPGYRRKRELISPKLAGFTGVIDAIMEADK
jgi:transposase